MEVGTQLITPAFVAEMKRKIAMRDQSHGKGRSTVQEYNPNSAEQVLGGLGFGVPRLYEGRTLSEMIAFLDATIGGSVAGNITTAVQRLFAEQKGILLMGPTGTGKTALAAAILRAWNAKHREWPGAFVHYPFYTLQRETLRGIDLDRMQMTVIRTRSLIVLDDVGFADLTWKGEFATELPSALKHLSTVISMRTAEVCPTIVTTNLDDTHMRAQYGEMVSSRFKDYSHVHLLGDDLRGDS